MAYVQLGVSKVNQWMNGYLIECKQDNLLYIEFVLWKIALDVFISIILDRDFNFLSAKTT